MSEAEARFATSDRGHNAVSPWAVPAAGWKDILLRTAKESSKDNIGLAAAGVAFYAFLALVPLMGAIVLTYGLVASPATVLKNMQSLTSVMPSDVAKLVGEQLLNVVQSSSGKKGLGLLLAIGIALFGARNAAGAIITSLNIAYEEEEKRGFIKVTLLALGITAAAVVAALGAVGLIAALGFLASVMPDAPAFVLLLIRITSAVLILIGAASAAATLYRYAPSRENAKWSWLTPGTLLSASGWLALSFAFGFYVSRFAHYGATYGSIGGVVALLTMVYLSSYIFLFGAELNSEVEHQTAIDTTTGKADPLGQRGAWSADHVAGDPEDEGNEAGLGDAPTLTRREHSANGDRKPTARERGYLVSRATNRATRIAAGAKIGMGASALSTVGLSLLRKRGYSRPGAVLIVTAVIISLFRRDDG